MPDSKEKSNDKLSRQIRKEVATAVQPLLDTVTALKQEIELLKQQTGTFTTSVSKTETKNGKAEIGKLRRKLKLSKQEFAELFGTGREEIRSWENGESKPVGEAAQLLEKLMAMDKKERAALHEAITKRRKEER